MPVLDRLPTPFDDEIHPADWRAWRDPDVPDWIDPIGVLLGRHVAAANNAKPAIVADGHPVSHAELEYLIRQYSAGLAATGLQPEVRMLMFGTDSLDYGIEDGRTVFTVPRLNGHAIVTLVTA